MPDSDRVQTGLVHHSNVYYLSLKSENKINKKRFPTQNNCDTAATNNQGCGVQMDDWRSYGPSFNEQGGGWYAVSYHDICQTHSLHLSSLQVCY